MGNQASKSNLRDAIVYLNITAEHIKSDDDKFWTQFWSEEDFPSTTDITLQEIRMLRDGSPRNFSILTYKMVERLMLATRTLCNTHGQQTAVLNATRILIRLIPSIFEDKAWRNFFLENHISQAANSEPRLIYPQKSQEERNYEEYLPSLEAMTVSESEDESEPETRPDELTKQRDSSSSPLLIDHKTIESTEQEEVPPTKTDKLITEDCLMKTLILSSCDLLFCPEFTVAPHNDGYFSKVVDGPPEDIRSLFSHNYIWEPGVGFDSDINSTLLYDKSRSELLRLLLTCFGSILCVRPQNALTYRNLWIETFASSDNRHALSLFTSLFNTIFGYKPYKPMNPMVYEDSRKELVECALQVMIATLDYHFDIPDEDSESKKNLFIEYLSRIHREDDIKFIIEGFKRLLNDGLEKGYTYGSQLIEFDHELLVILWKLCNLNAKFTQTLLGSKVIAEIVAPILYRLNESLSDPSKTGLIHTAIFNLIRLSGERNFGVRINKTFSSPVFSNLPHFIGTHADIMIIIFHRLILHGHNLYQLFDHLLTIITNISPFLTTMSMISSKCLVQLFEIFSSPYVIFNEPSFHHLTVLLFEIFNNIIQYQFTGNSNLICALLCKREIFINLSNLPTTNSGIQKVLKKLKQKDEERLAMLQSLTKFTDSSSLDRSVTPPCRIESTKIGGDYDPNSSLYAIVSSSSVKVPYMQGSSTKRRAVLIATPKIHNITQMVEIFEDPEVDDGPSEINLLPPRAADHKRVSKYKNEETHPTGPEASYSNVTPIDSNEVSKSSEDAKKSNEVLSASRKRTPTAEAIKRWKRSLPMETTLRMLIVLGPQLSRLEQRLGETPTEQEVINFLHSGTMVGLLPVPHPISLRKYRANKATVLWFRTCIWGIIYVRNSMWTGTKVRLIRTFN